MDRNNDKNERNAHDEILAWCRGEASEKLGHMVMRNRSKRMIAEGKAPHVVFDNNRSSGPVFEGNSWQEIHATLVTEGLIEIPFEDSLAGLTQRKSELEKQMAPLEDDGEEQDVLGVEYAEVCKKIDDWGKSGETFRIM